MTTILTEWLGLLTGGLTTMAQAIGKGVSNMALNMFCEYTVNESTGAVTIGGLSVFGSLVAIFAGISLCFGLSKLIYNFVKTH